MLQELAFTGQWRHYQKRVLDKSDAFMADGHLHLVAAPGSGNNLRYRIYPTLWATNPDLGTYSHDSSTMGRPDYPSILER